MLIVSAIVTKRFGDKVFDGASRKELALNRHTWDDKGAKHENNTKYHNMLASEQLWSANKTVIEARKQQQQERADSKSVLKWP